MIAKGCPKCDQQVPVACKACPCGYSFFKAKKAANLLKTEDRRRTQRVRRKKPNYYDSWEYERLIRKLRSSQYENEEEFKKKNTKFKKKKVKKEEEEEDDKYGQLNAEKKEQCSIILEELNRKMQLVTWKPT